MDKCKFLKVIDSTVDCEDCMPCNKRPHIAPPAGIYLRALTARARATAEGRIPVHADLLRRLAGFPSRSNEILPSPLHVVSPSDRDARVRTWALFTLLSPSFPPPSIVDVRFSCFFAFLAGLR